MKAKVEVYIARRLMNDALESCHLHQRVKVHDVEGEEADCFLIVKGADDERAARADLDFE